MDEGDEDNEDDDDDEEEDGDEDQQVLFILSLSSLLWRPTQLYLEGGGAIKRGHYYSSLQLTYTFKSARNIIPVYTFKTRTNTKNCEGSHSVCLFLCNMQL